MTNNLEEQRLLCSFDSSPDQSPPSLFLGPPWGWEAPPSQTNSPISLAQSSGCHLAGFLTAPASHALPAGTGCVCLLPPPLHLILALFSRTNLNTTFSQKPSRDGCVLINFPLHSYSPEMKLRSQRVIRRQWPQSKELGDM